MIGATGSAQRVGHILDAERARRELGDLPRARIARAADATAVHRLHIAEARRQARAFTAVAELHRGLALVVGLHAIDSISGSLPDEACRLMPAHVVDVDAQRALGACGGGRGQLRERRLLQLEALQRFGTIAIAQRLVACLAVCGLHHVAHDRHAVAPITIGQRFVDPDEGVVPVTREFERDLRHLATTQTGGGAAHGVGHLRPGSARGSCCAHIVHDRGDHDRLAGEHAARGAHIGTLTTDDDETARFEAGIQAVKFDRFCRRLFSCRAGRGVFAGGAAQVVRDRPLGQRERFALRIDHGAADDQEVVLRFGCFSPLFDPGVEVLFVAYREAQPCGGRIGNGCEDHASRVAAAAVLGTRHLCRHRFHTRHQQRLGAKHHQLVVVRNNTRVDEHPGIRGDAALRPI